MGIRAGQTVKLQCVYFTLCGNWMELLYSQAADDLCPIIYSHTHPSLLGASWGTHTAFKNYGVLSLFNKC